MANNSSSSKTTWLISTRLSSIKSNSKEINTPNKISQIPVGLPNSSTKHSWSKVTGLLSRTRKPNGKCSLTSSRCSWSKGRNTSSNSIPTSSRLSSSKKATDSLITFNRHKTSNFTIRHPRINNRMSSHRGRWAWTITVVGRATSTLTRTNPGRAANRLTWTKAIITGVNRQWWGTILRTKVEPWPSIIRRAPTTTQVSREGWWGHSASMLRPRVWVSWTPTQTTTRILSFSTMHRTRAHSWIMPAKGLWPWSKIKRKSILKWQKEFLRSNKNSKTHWF